MKQKLSKEQTPVFDCLFSQPPRRIVSPAPLSEQGPGNRRSFMPVYHVEKINKMKFKIYKQGGTQYIDKLPVADLSFQIKIKGDPEESSAQNAKPRLEEVLSEYRRLNLNQKKPVSRGGEGRQSRFGSDSSVRVMRKTVYRMGLSNISRR
jgi:hypothetical protein